MYTVTLDFGAGAVDYTAYLEGRYPMKRRRTVHNNLRPVVSTCRFAFKRSAALANAFLLASTDPVVVVLRDGGPYFSGTVRRTVKVSVGVMAIEALEVECVDALYRLEGRKCTSSYVWSNFQISNPSNKAESILHQLFYAAGFSDAELSFDAIATTVDRYVIDGTKSRTFRQLIETVLRDAVYTVMAGSDGVLRLYDLAPASISTSLSLTSGPAGNIGAGYSISRSEMQDEAVHVKYWTRELKEAAVVFEDTTGGNSTLPCSITLAAGEYYPEGAASGKSVRAKFAIKDREIISVTNAALDWQHTGDVVLEDSTVDGNSMMLRFYSATGGVIVLLKVTGDVMLKADECKVIREIVAGTSEIEEIESEILTAKADAERVANGRAIWHQYGQWRHEFKKITSDNTVSSDSIPPSDTLFPADDLYPWSDVTAPGEYAAFSEAQVLGASQTLRVVEVVDGDDPRAFALTCEGVSEYSAATLDEEITTIDKPLQPAPKSYLPRFLGDFASDPVSANEGDTYYNTVNLVLMIYSEGAWVQAVASPITTVETYAPRYLGRYSAAHPTSHNSGDWWLVYDTDDMPIQRGVWYDAAGTPARITTSSSAALQGKLIGALADIAWAEKNSFGTASDYGGFNSFFEAIGAVTAFIQELFAQNITMGSSGYLKSNNYTESGGYATAGLKIDAATGEVNSKSGKFVSANIKDATITNATVTGKATLAELVIADITAGSNIVKRNDSEVASVYSETTKTLTIAASGVIRTYFEACKTGSGTSTARIYINDVAVGTNRTLTGTYTAYTEDFSVSAGDSIKLIAVHDINSNYQFKNFRLMISEQPGILQFI